MKTNKKLQLQIKEIKQEMMHTYEVCGAMLNFSGQAFEQRDANAAKEVIDVLEPQLNAREVKLEKICIQTIALQKPSAKHLRFLVMLIKMNKDLERIGDLSVGIANSVLALLRLEKKAVLIEEQKEVAQMSRRLKKIFEFTFSTFKNEDIKEAKQIISQDKAINRLRDKIIKTLFSQASFTKKELLSNYQIIKITQKMERIGDLLKNIAEEIVYIASGEVLLHAPPTPVSGTRPRKPSG